ncbi:asparagine synthase (glutamine-hydrolysing) [Thiothrix eikelboomii]|uniref:asparagine synthase (glutamine-hydrolyzing) n=1 Tax=Thiothrix eikelboomii TaxID=92487 RepID=A0A1T4XIR2_9GAMM|nr:asparagine synthase (glutamine-hydrolyzing) [Thiothrix eikelboomii]SKA89414.1 asparagine synthase (glutamine-hydrolysing) [Thiothrix eikelboomii]
MCGIVGFQSFASLPDTRIVVQAMADSLLNRGPDSSGIWIDEHVGIALAHRRLAILELSVAGHQPMHSTSERYVIAFNGEVYNHNKLRAELKKANLSHCWRGHSDTETLLAAIETWGIEATLQRCIGMFAIALWDKESQTLTLARDRVGEKPLYYGWQGDTFLFGSELKALKTHPAFQADINRDALCLYMRHNYIPAPYSIYQGIQKLLPGTWLQVSRTQRESETKTYWSGVEVSRQGKATPFTGSPEDAVNTLENLLKNAIGQQMMADVPLGAFLSGGIDSSTVVALMQAQSSQPIKTFSIGFHEELYNEAAHAKEVAQHLGTDHTELYVTPDDCMQVIPRLPTLYDEPFADSSQIPTFLVSQLARQHVTVSLSGDAGDELFAGYNRYQLTANTWARLSRIPRPIRQWAAKTITSISPASWNRIANTLKSVIPSFGQWANMGDKLHKGARVMASHSAADLYIGMVSGWQYPTNVVIGGTEPPTFLTGYLPNLSHLNTVERMMVLDLLTYLPDDILCKIDRAAMGVSLESRVPFLDHRLIEFAWQLPLEYKLRENQTKWVLRQVLYRHVPKELIDRPKMGFGIPVDSWLRGSLRDWAENLLSESRLRQDGYFNPALIRQKWKEHLSGQRNWQNDLWSVLMFNAWIEH